MTTAMLDKIGGENKVTGEYFIYLVVVYLCQQLKLYSINEKSIQNISAQD
jgi:hypothetical protein